MSGRPARRCPSRRMRRDTGSATGRTLPVATTYGERLLDGDNDNNFHRAEFIFCGWHSARCMPGLIIGVKVTPSGRRRAHWQSGTHRRCLRRPLRPSWTCQWRHQQSWNRISADQLCWSGRVESGSGRVGLRAVCQRPRTVPTKRSWYVLPLEVQRQNWIVGLDHELTGFQPTISLFVTVLSGWYSVSSYLVYTDQLIRLSQVFHSTVLIGRRLGIMFLNHLLLADDAAVFAPSAKSLHYLRAVGRKVLKALGRRREHCRVIGK